MGRVWKIVKFGLVIAVVLLLVPWLTSLAYGNVDSDSGQAGVRVEAAEPPAAPTATIFGHAIGGVTPGDLFYIDAIDSPHDILASLYITNPHELTPYLRYLILKVAVYYEAENGQWLKMPLPKDDPSADTYITLRNSPVNFALPGLTRYKITIESGSYYCIQANKSGEDVSPQFYLTIEPI
jgi:hypothetical protein